MTGKFNRGLSRVFAGILGLLVLLAAVGEVRSQTLRDLETIRRSATLTPDDLQIMMIFVTSQFSLMENAGEVTELNKPLIDMESVSTSTSSNIQTRQQYVSEFARLIKENYGGLYQQGLDLAGQESPEAKELGANKKLAAAITLVMSGHPTLIEDLQGMLEDDSALVRACAVKGFWQDSMKEYLAQPEAGAELAGILSSLDERLNTENSAEVIMYAAMAAGLVDNAQSTALLQKCVARRVSQYQSWEVSRESADGEILGQLIQVAQQKLTANDRRGATELLRSATELYISAYHRYRMGKAYRKPDDNKEIPLLTEDNRLSLKSLLIIGEIEFMEICNRPTSNNNSRAVFMALRDASESNLPNAVDSLTGLAGLVQQSFSIYDGWTAPGELPAPPAAIVQKAENLQKIKANVIKISS